MAETNRIDDLLYAVTQQSANGVHGLLDSVFGFLQRRTDFFYEAEPGDKMGFPPQMAESMVYQYFRKYQAEHQKRFPPKPETKKRWEEYERQRAAQRKDLEEKGKEIMAAQEAKEEEKKPDQSKPAAEIKPAAEPKPSQPI